MPAAATPAGGGAKAVKSLSPSSGKGKGLISSAKDEANTSAAGAAAGGAKAAAAGGGVKAALELRKDAFGDGVITAPKAKANLHEPDIFVRIRPLATEGGHAEDGTVLTKHLETWDETSVTIETQYLFSKGGAKYAYPKRVFGTEASQEEVTAGMVPELVESYTVEKQSVLFFAYGQTGTGKTRTMLGTEPSLAASSPHEDWGVFPRVCAATFEKMASMRQAGQKCVLLGSAIEFYLGECYDLLKSDRRSGNAPVHIDFESHMPEGESCVQLETTADLMGFLASVIANRTSRSTNFNQSSKEHSGSSRSHAALMLTLMQLDEASREYLKTSFTLVDLAGAERPDKVKAEDKSGGQVETKSGAKMQALAPEFLPKLIEARDCGAMSQKDIDKMMPINFQTRVINHELFQLGGEVVKATEAHTKGKPYKSPHAMITPTIKFLSAIFDGRARLSMCVTLSPAGQNAWETWFSLQYGADLAKLHAPRRKDKAQNVDKLHKTVAKEAAALQKEVDGMDKKHRYYEIKAHKARVAAEAVRRLEMVLGSGGAASSSKEGGESSKDGG